MIDRMGDQLGNYQVIKQLGRGSFATVYLGQHLFLKRQAAIKVLHTHLGKHEEKPFLDEARIIADLNHPHIIPIWEFGLDRDGIPFLVMPYAPKGTLRERHPLGETLLTVSAILPYVEQLAQALDYLHDRKLVHRDVKPANVLVQANGQLWLSDFGIAAIAHGTGSLRNQGYAGTPAYMAPEQRLGWPSPQSDQYALAVMVYSWLTGRLPELKMAWEPDNQHPDVVALAHQEDEQTLPPPVKQIVLKALSVDARRRFERVQEFASALRQVAQEESSISIGGTTNPQAVVAPLYLRPTPLPREIPLNNVQEMSPTLVEDSSMQEQPLWLKPTHTLPPPTSRYVKTAPLPARKGSVLIRRAIFLFVSVLVLILGTELGYAGLLIYKARSQVTNASQLTPTPNEQAPTTLYFGHNLIVNGDAEKGRAATTNNDLVAVPAWNTAGSFTVVQYGTPDFPTSTDPGPSDRGHNFFAGGPSSPYEAADPCPIVKQATIAVPVANDPSHNVLSCGVQSINVATIATVLDKGTITYNLSGYLGGTEAERDKTYLVIQFVGATNTALGIAKTATPDRQKQTKLVKRTLTDKIPAGTRMINVWLVMVKYDFTYNDGYADNIMLVLSPSS